MEDYVTGEMLKNKPPNVMFDSAETSTFQADVGTKNTCRFCLGARFEVPLRVLCLRCLEIFMEVHIVRNRLTMKFCQS